jgi:hypothetical protein
MSSIAEIVESLPEDDRLLAAEKVVQANRKLERFDSTVASSLLRILKSPLGEVLRSKIKEIANNG